jgi:hypothetical protein
VERLGHLWNCMTMMEKTMDSCRISLRLDSKEDHRFTPWAGFVNERTSRAH